MAEAKCPTCRWFEPMASKRVGVVHGLCRKAPPVVISRVETQGVGILVTKAHTSFPYVRETDWCGEHYSPNE